MIYRILESIHYNIIMVEQPLIINTLVELGSTIEPTPTDKVILPMLKANGRARLSSMLCWWLPYAMILAISGEPTNSWWRSSTLAGCRLARFSWNPARDYWHIYSPGCIIYIYGDDIQGLFMEYILPIFFGTLWNHHLYTMLAYIGFHGNIRWNIATAPAL